MQDSYSVEMLLKTGQLGVALWTVGGAGQSWWGSKRAKLDKETPISPCSQTECAPLFFFSETVSVEQNPWIWEMFHLVCQESSKAKVKKSSLFVSAT